jgi:hypothetical protein
VRKQREDFLFVLEAAGKKLNWDGPMERRAQHDFVRQLWDRLCAHLSIEKVRVFVDP